ncbi:MAG: MBOAT family O-acyltransferase [bacterium]
MIFTSYSYVAFLIGAFVVHWLLPERARKLFLVGASYFFYCSWRPAFGFLLLGLSLFDWAYGRWVLPRAKGAGPLVIGIAANLLPLVYFKYAGFLVSNAAALVEAVGGTWHPRIGDILLPIGVSFFTFQGMAYVIDVAAGEEPIDSAIDFLLFKVLWPQLIAGPIVRLSEMREQLSTPRRLEYDAVSEGSRRILFGMFKKVVLADALAPIVDSVYGSQALPHAADAVFATLAFGMQIYFDFSAYSDIAIGSALLFGFRLPENFDWPYLSRSPQEFWSRWHMTLSRWIRDYVFVPLTFATRDRPSLRPLWLLLAMALCGLWHGAAWTFVGWGVWHGLLLVLGQGPLKTLFAGRTSATTSSLRAAFAGAMTFVLVQAGWILFRARTLTQAGDIVASILSLRGGFTPAILRVNGLMIVAFLFALLLGAQTVKLLTLRYANAGRIPSLAIRVLAPVIYTAMLIAVIIFDQEARAFVYFQF